MADATESSSVIEDAGIRFCACCHDEKQHWHLITAPCGDLYCEPCLVEFFSLAMKDETLFPPCCCKQPITFQYAGSVLSAAQRLEFEEKFVEFSTTNRTYCHDATYAAFIPPADIDGEKAACQVCERLTCVVCKAAAHDGHCPEDSNYLALMRVAAVAGYHACYQCKRMIELDPGCYHMT